MGISEFETNRFVKIIQKFIEEHGPPAEIHDQLKWAYWIDLKSQNIELFEIPLAKTTYV